MTTLSPRDRERTITHLGYGALEGIPAGDLARLEEGLTRVRSAEQARIISLILDACDEWFRIWLLSPAEIISEITTKELITGDTNRAVLRTSNPDEAQKSVWKNYLARCEELAQQLWVINYRDPLNLDYRFERSGGDFIRAIPGPADTAIGSSIYTIQINGGGFGIPAY